MTDLFNKAKEFYSPKKSSEFGELGIPDDRTTIYWNPNLQLRAGEAHKIKLMSSAIKANYNIVVQGISDSGNILYGISSFMVN